MKDESRKIFSLPVVYRRFMTAPVFMNLGPRLVLLSRPQFTPFDRLRMYSGCGSLLILGLV
jgi:hypothetical protein